MGRKTGGQPGAPLVRGNSNSCPWAAPGAQSLCGCLPHYFLFFAMFQFYRAININMILMFQFWAIFIIL